MASPSELSLDCKPNTYSMLLKSFGDHHQSDPTENLEEQLARLEEERLKIDAFKRELPLCMQLLTNAVENSRQQLQSQRANQASRPVLEEFMPIKHSNSENSEKLTNASDKANWMTSAQLWSQASDGTKQQTSLTSSNKETDIGFRVSPRLDLDNKQRNGGAFLPFSKERNSCPSPTLRSLPELALVSTEKEMDDKKVCENENGTNSLKKENSGKNGGSTNPSEGLITSNTNCSPSQTHRKARRCWSPDLHRRFVHALHTLGGSQAATPKQIRELMKVDGLTNDEVKSHLQKYRLHTRRPSPNPQATGAPGPQLVVLGGIWVPSEYATAAAGGHAGTPTLYASHASSHYCQSPLPQEFYTAASAPPPPPPPHHQLHHHTLHQQLQLYNPHGSPESDLRGAGDRSESIEDGKSESSSWKGDSGENGGKCLSRLREDGDESNGSEITLKF